MVGEVCSVLKTTGQRCEGPLGDRQEALGSDCSYFSQDPCPIVFRVSQAEVDSLPGLSPKPIWFYIPGPLPMTLLGCPSLTEHSRTFHSFSLGPPLGCAGIWCNLGDEVWVAQVFSCI